MAAFRLAALRLVAFRLVALRLVAFRLAALRLVAFRFVALRLVAFRFVALRLVAFGFVTFFLGPRRGRFGPFFFVGTIARRFGTQCMSYPRTPLAHCGALLFCDQTNTDPASAIYSELEENARALAFAESAKI